MRKKRFQRTVFLLLLILLLPLLFYSAYEFGTRNHTEKIMQEVYRQQLNTALFSVNQYAWDISRSWRSQIERIRLLELDPDFVSFFQSAPAVSGVFFADTALTAVDYFPAGNQENQSQRLQKLLQTNRAEIRDLMARQSQGYDRMISLSSAGHKDITDDDFAALFVLTSGTERCLSGMLIDPGRFVQLVLRGRLQELSRDEFRLGIFRKKDDLPVFSTEDFTAAEIIESREIWILPDLYIGMAFRKDNLETLVRRRVYRNLILVSLVDLLLIIAAVFVYRGIRRELDLAKMKSDFVSNVSHELRTPLSLIRMFAETLEMDRVSGEDKKHSYYSSIRKETERLTHLINNILNFAKMEEGRKRYQLTRQDLNELVAETLEQYRFHLDQSGFRLQIDLAEAQLPVRADQSAVTEALINLLDNAMKYSQDHKEIRVSTMHEDRKAVIELRDFGIGIPAAEQQRIFEKFYRITEGLVHDVKGSGLGLTIVSHIMKAHEGEIRLQSKLGEGSKFRLIFPLIQTGGKT